MPIVFGVWFVLAGGLAALVGGTDLRRIKRLRAHGEKVWAAVTPRQVEDGEDREDREDSGAGGAGDMSLQYQLPDGRVMERMSSLPASKAAARRPRQKVLIWYDPKEPDDILVYGRREGTLDVAFLVAGTLLILAGIGMAAFG
jgi:hypothetical protein